MGRQIALIIGAGPAGLTAAYELLDKTEILPIIIEASAAIGGISRTECYQGNRIDIGGHRFFSKSDRVMDWWRNILPLQGAPARDDRQLRRDVQLADTACCRAIGATEAITRPAPDPEVTDEVMLVRHRMSRILFLRKFFDYPISLSRSTMANLGLLRLTKIAAGYARARLRPIRPAKSLEDFFINQFGVELYQTFFRDYTEKVWGVPCREIPPAWGAQRIKGLSLAKALLHALRGLTRRPATVAAQQQAETSLISAFLYPKHGPGHLWETVAARILAAGGEIRLQQKVVGLTTAGDRVTGVVIEDQRTGARETLRGEQIISTMPVRDLVNSLPAEVVPAEVRRIANGLQYRDFMTVGVLATRLKLRNNTDQPTLGDIAPDNWIYIQEPDVRVGRLQLFNNWSPYLVADPNNVWMGMEYFCYEGDEMWRMEDVAFSHFAVEELAKIGVVDAADVLDTVVIRVPKAYPAYFGAYAEFGVVRDFTDYFTNLSLIGRNGMHRYNNMDHSMLAAMTAVENIRDGVTDKANLWAVNSEEDYHETKGSAQ